jgi:large subunit ribosomal protein L19
MPNIIA